jgi:hypothetical protein
MSSLLEFAVARSSLPLRPVAQFNIDNYNMVVMYDYEKKGYYIVNPEESNTHIRIPDDFTISNTITWFYNTYCAPMMNRQSNYTTPSFVLHKKVGHKLYPLRTLSPSTSIRMLRVQWHELSPNPVVGTLNFKQ